MTDNLSYYYYNIGLKNARIKDITHAIDALSIAVVLKEDNIPAWNLLGLCYYRLGKLPTAEHCWMTSLYISNGITTNDKANANSVNNANNASGTDIASIADNDNSAMPNNMASDYLRCVREDIKVIEDRITGVKTLIAEKKYKKALRVMEKEFARNLRQKNDKFTLNNFSDFKIDKNVMLLNYIGLLYMLNKKRRKALRAWEKAISLDTSNPDTLKYILHAFNAYK
jgi:tetratricopeptide (TPR) repeat protein